MKSPAVQGSCWLGHSFTAFSSTSCILSQWHQRIRGVCPTVAFVDSQINSLARDKSFHFCFSRGMEREPFAFSWLDVGIPQTKPGRAQGLFSSRNRIKHHRFLKVTDSCLSFFFFFPETWQVVCYARSHRLADLPPPTESQGQCLGSLDWGWGAQGRDQRGRVGSHLGTSVPWPVPW